MKKYFLNSLKTSKLFWRYIKREQFLLSFKGLASLLALITIVWFLYALVIFIAVPTKHLGTAGDMFGGITALFSGLAFAGLIYTLFVQKKELQYQRKELTHLVEEQAASREQLQAQAEHMDSQNKQLKIQAFENTFFALLTQFRDFKGSMAKDTRSGQDQLDLLCKKVFPSINIRGRRNTQNSVQLVGEYIRLYNLQKADLAPYYRHIYNILKFISRSEIADKKVYSNFLRADLNHLELAALTLNAASTNGEEKLKPLLKEFDFLKHFDRWDLFEHECFTPDLVYAFSDFDFYLKRQEALKGTAT